MNLQKIRESVQKIWENKEMYIWKVRFSSKKNKDLFNDEKNKEVYIKNKVMYIFLSKK